MHRKYNHFNISDHMAETSDSGRSSPTQRQCSPMKEKYSEIFQRYYSDLVKAAQHNLLPLANELFSRSIISSEVLAKAMHTPVLEFHRASQLLSCLHDKIKADPGVLLKFLEILEKEPTLASLAQRISGIAIPSLHT